MSQLLFTDRSIANLPFEKGKQRIVRDTELPGFFLRIGARTKAYMIQGDLRIDGVRQTVLMKVGTAGDISTREARAKAKRLLGDILAGIDPRPKPETEEEPAVVQPGGVTLRSAWASYRVSHMERKGRSQKTISEYEGHVDRLMADWLDKPLKELGDEPVLVNVRHDQITEENGPYMANGCMRTFRAVYNHARKTARYLPAENPVIAVDWNPEKRRDTAMGEEDYSDWFEQVRAIDNPLRRELHLLILLSGSRPEAIKTIRLDEIKLRHRMLVIPNPKGGETKAFVIPLSCQMIRCIARAMRFGRSMHPDEAQTWLFPADSASGHIAEHKEDRKDLRYWGNDLRQTYRTAGQPAEISEVDMHLLMNHSVPGVNGGYITRVKLLNHLRGAQQELSDYLLASTVEADPERKFWPRASASTLLRDEFPIRLDAQRGEGGQRCSRNMAVFRGAAPGIRAA